MSCLKVLEPPLMLCCGKCCFEFYHFRGCVQKALRSLAPLTGIRVKAGPRYWSPLKRTTYFSTCITVTIENNHYPLQIVFIYFTAL